MSASSETSHGGEHGHEKQSSWKFIKMIAAALFMLVLRSIAKDNEEQGHH